MKRFVEGEDRQQATLLPACLDDYVTEDNPVRVIDVFIDELDLEALGFAGVVPEVTGRPAYHPATLLVISKCVREHFRRPVIEAECEHSAVGRLHPKQPIARL